MTESVHPADWEYIQTVIDQLEHQDKPDWIEVRKREGEIKLVYGLGMEADDD